MLYPSLAEFYSAGGGFFICCFAMRDFPADTETFLRVQRLSLRIQETFLQNEAG